MPASKSGSPMFSVFPPPLPLVQLPHRTLELADWASFGLLWAALGIF